MGASEFFADGWGKTPAEAFNEARERAQYNYGHAGYTGTIAEKHDFILFKLPEGMTPMEFADSMIDDPKVDDKWGPAGAVEFPSDYPAKNPVARERLANGERCFLFFGWASS